MRSRCAAMVASLLMATAAWSPAGAAEIDRVLPAPQIDEPATATQGPETAVLAGGCFWGIQGVFQHVGGVEQVLAGYAGGTQATAHYETVSTGTTGHAESVEIKFDPKVISYGQILRIFFSVALDPTELNRQGPDSGPQYRSVVFYESPAQQRVAESYIAQLDKSGIFPRPIVTRVDPASGFYPAEAYHQDFLLHHPDNLYIVINDLPKVANLKRLFPANYREAPVTVAARSGS